MDLPLTTHRDASERKKETIMIITTKIVSGGPQSTAPSIKAMCRCNHH